MSHLGTLIKSEQVRNAMSHLGTLIKSEQVRNATEAKKLANAPAKTSEVDAIKQRVDALESQMGAILRRKFKVIRQQVEATQREAALKCRVEAERLQSIEKLETIDARLERLEVTMTSVLDTVTQLMLEK